jgi:hypothetical protein
MPAVPKLEQKLTAYAGKVLGQRVGRITATVKAQGPQFGTIISFEMQTPWSRSLCDTLLFFMEQDELAPTYRMQITDTTMANTELLVCVK